MPFFNRMIPVAPFSKNIVHFFWDIKISMGLQRSRNAFWVLCRSHMNLLYTQTIVLFIKNSGSVYTRPGRLKTFKMQGPEAIIDKINGLALFG